MLMRHVSCHEIYMAVSILTVSLVTGAPTWSQSEKTAALLQGAIGLAANAPHPSAARVVLDFVLPKEGQVMMQSWGRMVARSDVVGLRSGPMKNLTVVPVKPELGEKLEEYSTLLRELFSRPTTQ